MRARGLAVATIAWGLWVPCGPLSAAQAPIQEAVTTLGTLTCSLGGEPDTKAVGQGRNLLCRFRPGGQGAEETYVGSLQGVGQTAALFGRGTLMLTVKGPAATEFAPGLLQQTYEADAASSGAVPAPLIGTRNKSIVLQPLIEEEGRVAAGKTQPESIVIVVELKLESTPA